MELITGHIIFSTFFHIIISRLSSKALPGCQAQKSIPSKTVQAPQLALNVTFHFEDGGPTTWLHLASLGFWFEV